MQKKSTTPPKKPTTDASSESLLEPSEPSRWAIGAIRFHCYQNPWGLGSKESREQMRKREIPFAAYKVTNINHCVRNLSKLCMNLCACVTKKVYAFKGSNFKDCSTTFVKKKNKKDFKDCVLCVFLCNMCMDIFFLFLFLNKQSD